MPLQQRALAAVVKIGIALIQGESMAEESLVNFVTTTYLGDGRVRITAGDRCFEADQRLELDRPGASFCPLELVASALGA